MYSIYEVQRRQSIDSDLYEYTDLLVSGLGGQSSDLSEIYNELLEAKEKPSGRTRAHRFLLASNDSVTLETNAFNSPDSLLEALNEKNQFSFSAAYNTIMLNNLEYRTYARPITTPLRKKFQLIVVTPMDRLYESLNQLKLIFVIICPIALIIFGFIGFIFTRRAFAPVRAITQTAAAISSQSLEKRVPIGKSEDEIAQLAKTFNQMIERLHKTFISQQRFIADASHDIRTPLTVIQMELELLLNSKDLSQKSELAIQTCLIEIDSLGKLAENLLFLARADSQQLLTDKKVFRIDELILECVSQLNTIAKSKNIVFKININKPLEIKADEPMIRRMIFNILDNALKYSTPNEAVGIMIGNNSTEVLIQVNNNGIPIPEELLAKIFDRFQRAERSRTSKGFGLGLAIVKAIVDVHNGKITIESNEKKGTSFTISLPLISSG